MKPFRRWVALATSITAAVGAAVALVPGSPASAISHPGHVISIDHPISADYGPIAGSWPGGQDDLVVVEPYDCFTPAAPSVPEDPTNPHTPDGAFAAACDNIPLKIIPPNVKDEDDWILELEVSFPDPSGEGLADFDIYLYDNKQIKALDGEDGYTRVANGPGTTNPEPIKLFEPDLGDYNLVIVNFAGVNAGYTLTAKLSNTVFTAPFELLAPSFRFSDLEDDGPVEDLSGVEDPVTPFDFSAEPADGIVPAAPTFGQVAALPDDDFRAFPATDFDETISAPPIVARPAASLAPLKPASAPVVLFWMVLVPLALLGVAAVLMIRRSRRSVSFS
jgi:hypothetical protein